MSDLGYEEYSDSSDNNSLNGIEDYECHMRVREALFFSLNLLDMMKRVEDEKLGEGVGESHLSIFFSSSMSSDLLMILHHF
jgi:hypothetical protein